MLRRILKRAYIAAIRAHTGIAHRLVGIDRVAQIVARLPAGEIAQVLARYGATIGDGASFKDGLQIDNAGGDEDATGDFSNLVIGRRCYIGKGVFFDLPDRIVLEDEVVLSAGVKILTHADVGQRMMRRWYSRVRAPVRIGEGTWVGVNAVILSGVTLGRCCVVAAGAIVTKGFPAYSVVAGVPARTVRMLDPEEPGSDPVRVLDGHNR